MKRLRAILAAIGFLTLTPSLKAANVSEIFAAVDQIKVGPLDSTQIYDLSNVAVRSVDLEIELNGRIAMFEPLLLNSDTIYYGGLFTGDGRFSFSPRLSIEQFQLQRFFKSDSLDRRFDEMLLLFNESMYDSIRAQGTPITGKPDEGYYDGVRKYLNRIANEGGTGTTFEIMRLLRSALFPMSRPFLFVGTSLNDGGHVHYSFDQYETEEVTLDKKYWAPGENFMENICQYSVYADNSYEMINGIPKDVISIEYYDITSDIARNGKYTGRADVRIKTRLPAAQFLNMGLHGELKIDSIVSSAGGSTAIYRYEKHGDWSYGFFAVFDTAFPLGDTTTISFYYHGDILEQTIGEFFVDAGASWYPRYGYSQRAEFDLNFTSPEDYLFVASGKLIEESKDDRIYSSRWKSRAPTDYMTFNIGTFKKYEFREPDVVPVDVYYSKDLHRAFAAATLSEMTRSGKDMEKQVADDVINSLRLFNHYFGKQSSPEIMVTENMTVYGEAYPGLIALGFGTWMYTDAYGYDRMLRAHEVSHQWWGVGVDVSSYHDRWLVEAFAEYSGMLYFQAAADSKKFLEKLEDIRERIFSNRKYIFGSGEEAGPIALGYRTSSTRSGGDYGLIIYEKGAFVLHMLRNMMMNLSNFNEDAFFSMMREFYNKYKGGYATTRDFQKMAEKYTGIELDWFFKQWVYSTELPTYKFDYSTEQQDDGRFGVTCTILTEEVAEDFKMYVPLEIEFDGGRKAYIRVLIDKKDFQFDIPGLAEKPKKLKLNPFESVLAEVKQ